MFNLFSLIRFSFAVVYLKLAILWKLISGMELDLIMIGP